MVASTQHDTLPPRVDSLGISFNDGYGRTRLYVPLHHHIYLPAELSRRNVCFLLDMLIHYAHRCVSTRPAILIHVVIE